MSENGGDAPAATGPDAMQEWEIFSQGQTALFKRIIDANAELSKQVEDLKSDLSLHKAGWVTLNKENRALFADVSRLEKSLSMYQNDQTFVICLIDGDGAIFHEDFIVKGKEGGQEAANELSHGIIQQLEAIATSHDSGPSSGINSTPIHRTLHQNITTIIFMNVKGLAATLANNGICSVPVFEQFIHGFNQAAPLFTIVDVGRGKEAADAKLRENLLFYCRLHQTKKIIFGGAHDSGYLPTLKILKTEGTLDKVVILKGNLNVAHEMSNFMQETNLPTMQIRGLFLQQKLVPTGKSPKTNSRAITPSLVPGNIYHPSSTTGRVVDSDEGSVASDHIPRRNKAMSPTPMRAARPSQPSSAVPQHFARSSLGLSADPDYSPAAREPSSPIVPSGPNVIIDLKRPLTKQRPPLCNFYYLDPSGCSNGHMCRYSHHYVLSPTQCDEFRMEVKAMPCLNLLKAGKCSSGLNCMMSHVCPNGPQCKYLRKGGCKFAKDGMHLGLAL